MERQIQDIPVLQKSKETRAEPVKTDSGCCAKPSSGSACCTPSKDEKENNGACCAQPDDGSACCDK